MISFFVCCDDSDYLSYLCNSILLSCKNATLVGFSTNLSMNIINICKTQKPNIIITNKPTQLILHHFLKFNYITITISQNNELSIKKICNLVKIFSSNLKYTEKISISNFKAQTLDILEWMHFNPNLNGTKYIVDCISYIYDNQNKKIYKRDLFDSISNKYNISIFTIYWNIYTAIEEMRSSSTEDFQRIVYGTTDEITLKTVIKAFVEIY